MKYRGFVFIIELSTDFSPFNQSWSCSHTICELLTQNLSLSMLLSWSMRLLIDSLSSFDIYNANGRWAVRLRYCFEDLSVYNYSLVSKHIKFVMIRSCTNVIYFANYSFFVWHSAFVLARFSTSLESALIPRHWLDALYFKKVVSVWVFISFSETLKGLLH